MGNPISDNPVRTACAICAISIIILFGFFLDLSANRDKALGEDETCEFNYIDKQLRLLRVAFVFKGGHLHPLKFTQSATFGKIPPLIQRCERTNFFAN